MNYYFYKTYKPWIICYCKIQQRCHNPKDTSYKNYGKKGIKNLFTSSEEIKFLWFRDKAYLMQRPSIDRINNDGNYELSNCRFIELKENIGKRNKLFCSKPILQFDKQGNFIQEWISIAKAENILKINKANIHKVLNGQRKTTGGFKWKYKYAENK